MEKLFARHAPKRGKVYLMLAGSLVFHGGLVGIGALFVQPPPPYVEVDWQVPEESVPTPASVPETVVPENNSPQSTATPEPLEPTFATPPPSVDEPNFAEPASPTPRSKALAVRSMVPSRQTGPRAPVSAASGSSGSGPASVPAVARGASWVTPHPPYPAFIRNTPVTGVTTVRVTTDAEGRVSNVVIVRSAGSALLDAHTVSYVRNNWHGPANAARTTEFIYQLR